MDFLTDTFNNRELATFLWLLFIVIVLLFNKKIRASIFTLIKSFTQKYVLLVFSLMLLYVCFQVVFFYNIKLWDFTLVKDTIYWTLGVAFVLLIDVNDASKNQSYFKNVIQNNIKLVIIIEFIANIYTFNFITELFIIPIVSFLVIIAAFTKSRKEYLSVTKLANVIIGVFGFIIIMYFFINIISNFQNFWSLDNLRAFLLPILLVITFIPFLYIVAIYMKYELLFARIGLYLKKDKDAMKYAKKQIFALCKFDLAKLNRFMKKNIFTIMRLNDKVGIDKIINDFK